MQTVIWLEDKGRRQVYQAPSCCWHTGIHREATMTFILDLAFNQSVLTANLVPRPVLVAQVEYLLPGLRPREPPEPRAGKVDKVSRHDPVPLAAHVDAEDLLALPQQVVLLLLRRVEQEVQLGGGQRAVVVRQREDVAGHGDLRGRQRARVKTVVRRGNAKLPWLASKGMLTL